MSSAEDVSVQAGDGDQTAEEAASAPGRAGRWYGSLSPTDLVITLVLGSMLLWAHIEALSFTFRAGLFPRAISGAGVLLCILRLATAIWNRHAPVDGEDEGSSQERSVSGTTDTDEDSASENADVEYVFAHASNRDWTTALAWVAAFIFALWLVGIYVAAPLFSLVYLTVVAKMRWWGSLIYAAAAWVVLFWTFDVLLRIRMPTGIFV